MTRYLKITLVDDTRFILRVTRDSRPAEGGTRMPVVQAQESHRHG